jgi:hypothetical protein
LNIHGKSFPSKRKSKGNLAATRHGIPRIARRKPIRTSSRRRHFGRTFNLVVEGAGCVTGDSDVRVEGVDTGEPACEETGRVSIVAGGCVGDGGADVVYGDCPGWSAWCSLCTRNLQRRKISSKPTQQISTPDITIIKPLRTPCRPFLPW